MPNNEMDYSLIHRTPDGNGKILVTTPGSPDKGSWETEAELKTYVNQDTVMKTDIVQSLGQQTDKVPSNAAVDDAINAINTRVTNIEETLMGENEVTVQYPDDGNYPSLMPNRVPARALKFAEVPSFRGKSRAWNQLCPIDVLGSKTVSDVTITNNGDGSYTLNGTASSNIAEYLTGAINLPIGHKILFGYVNINTAITGLLMRDQYSFSATETTTIWQCSVSTSAFAVIIANGTVLNNVKIVPIIRDLTLIFGAGNEPSTVADALAQLPALGQYNAYDAGSLVDTVVSGARSVGVNIWDEEWESGAIDFSTGAKDQNADCIRSKNYIPVSPNTEYAYKCASQSNIRIAMYDANKAYVSSVIINSATMPYAFTTPSGVRHVMFYISGTTYNHDIQICLNSYTDKTTYHPYKTDTLSLSEPVTLRSAGAVSEVLTLETGKKTRPIGSVDLGTLTWYYDAPYFWARLTDMKGRGYLTNLLCPKYVTARSSVDFVDKTITGVAVFYDDNILVKDSDYSSSSAFKTAMNGVMLNYELATPLSDEQVCDPVPYNFLEVEGGGTINTIQDQTPVIDNCLDVTYDIIPQ